MSEKLKFIIQEKFIQNPQTRNALSKFSGIIIGVFVFLPVIYALITPFEKINYYVFGTLGTILLVLNFLYKRLWLEVKNVCPSCLENDAIIQEELSRDLVSSQQVSDGYSVYENNIYNCTGRNYCKYCDYNITYQYSDKKQIFLYKTQAGLMRDMLREHRQEVEAENRRHEEVDFQNQIKANEDYLNKKEKMWKRIVRDYRDSKRII